MTREETITELIEYAGVLGKPLGGTRKIADLPTIDVCLSPTHYPPGYCVFPPGIYEHTCLECGHTMTFTVGVEARW